MTSYRKTALFLTLFIAITAGSPAFSKIRNFQDAVVFDNLKKAEYFLQKGADINAKVFHGKTALMYSADFRQIKMLKLLIKKKADVNLKTGSGETALMYALGVPSDEIERYTTTYQKYEMAKLLVNSGADIKSSSDLNWTALHYALLGKTDLRLIKFLVSKGADINQQGKYGETPLMLAATRLHPAIVKYLIQKGADVKIRKPDGDNAFLAAIEFISNYGFKNSNKPIYQKKLEILDMLLKAGTDINSNNNKGEYPFHRIVTYNAAIIKHLIKLGADVNKKDKEGKTVLKIVEEKFQDGYLKQKEYKKIKKLLLAAEAKPEKLNNNYTKYLFGAITSGNLKRVKKYLKKGADINGYDEMGNTPLISSLKKMNYKIAQYLIQKGADVNAKTKKGVPTLQAVQGIDYTLKSSYRTTKYFILLLKFGADVNAVDSEGRTSLMYAAKTNDLDATKFLISKKADTNITDKNENNPLHYLNLYGDVKIAKLLYKAKININHQNNSGTTPAMQAFRNRNLELLKFLIIKGANVKLKNSAGKSLIDMSDEKLKTDKYYRKFYEAADKLIKEKK